MLMLTTVLYLTESEIAKLTSGDYTERRMILFCKERVGLIGLELPSEGCKGRIASVVKHLGKLGELQPKGLDTVHAEGSLMSTVAAGTDQHATDMALAAVGCKRLHWECEDVPSGPWRATSAAIASEFELRSPR